MPTVGQAVVMKTMLGRWGHDVPPKVEPIAGTRCQPDAARWLVVKGLVPLVDGTSFLTTSLWSGLGWAPADGSPECQLLPSSLHTEFDCSHRGVPIGTGPVVLVCSPALKEP